MKSHNSFENQIKSKSYIWQATVISIVLLVGIQLIRYFVPDFLFSKGTSYLNQLNEKFFQIGSNFYGLGVAFCIFDLLSILLMVFNGWVFFRYFINCLTYEKWYTKYLDVCSNVIESCDISAVKSRVALIIPICNDISEHTIKQTANQTYKCDVWLLDDSSNDESKNKIDVFAKTHGYNVLHRSDEHKKTHPSKVGNIYYFLQFNGNNYDYILETDSSSIVTSTFVENALKFFNSPMIDQQRLSAIVCNGSFYPTNNVFSWINAKQSQWTEAHMLNSSMRMGGSHVSYQGWGTFIKVECLKKIPLEEVECSMCDIARGFYISRHGWNCYMDPFDFSGKIAQQNMYRWKNQRMKWAGGDAFIFKHLVAGKKFDDWQKTLFIQCWSFTGTICIPLMVTLQIVSLALSCSCNFLPIMNWSALIMIIILCVVFGISILVLMIVNHISWKTFIASILSLLYEFAILFRRTYQLLIYGLMFGKWSSAKITVKSKEKLSFVQWIKVTAFDWCWILVSLSICLILNYCSNVNHVLIWANLFLFIAGPSIVYIVMSLLSYKKTKNGWNNDVKFFDIAGNDFRFKYVKESRIWKKQHPSLQ